MPARGGGRPLAGFVSGALVLAAPLGMVPGGGPTGAPQGADSLTFWIAEAGGSYLGAQPDLARAIGERLHRPVRFLPYRLSPKGLHDEVAQTIRRRPGTILLDVPADFQAPPGHGVRLSVHYARTGWAWFSRPGVTVSLEQLADAQAAVGIYAEPREALSTADVFLMGYRDGALRDRLVHYATLEEAGDAVRRGAVRAALLPLRPMAAYLSANPALRVVLLRSDSLVIAWDLAAAFVPPAGGDSGETSLEAQLNRALAALRADGTVRDVLRRHEVGDEPLPGPPSLTEAQLAELEANPFGGNPEMIAAGERLYRRACLYCHGESGGARGPDLRKSSLSDQSFFRVVMNGRPGTLMPAWRGQLQPSEVWQIRAFLTAPGPGRGR